eukprot:gnl/MRDRNA2_/MRDRNA2_164669_c0_seq1.p1 gnl/MRDRNA2_/MRDRNA2_164669_c0~~gnl/MRDRNA2_/MRDRNA2_164669_c0_seq1.p1  ORF type:complete len:237 (+),score=32.80 gnl/MRDRNA2_/MRDRNA2_164669_c0_seq1:31-711(+)
MTLTLGRSLWTWSQGDSWSRHLSGTPTVTVPATALMAKSSYRPTTGMTDSDMVRIQEAVKHLEGLLEPILSLNPNEVYSKDSPFSRQEKHRLHFTLAQSASSISAIQIKLDKWILKNIMYRQKENVNAENAEQLDVNDLKALVKKMENAANPEGYNVKVEGDTVDDSGTPLSDSDHLEYEDQAIQSSEEPEEVRSSDQSSEPTAKPRPRERLQRSAAGFVVGIGPR